MIWPLQLFSWNLPDPCYCHCRSSPEICLVTNYFPLFANVSYSCGQASVACNQASVACNQASVACNQAPVACNLASVACNQASVACNLVSVACNPSARTSRYNSSPLKSGLSPDAALNCNARRTSDGGTDDTKEELVLDILRASFVPLVAAVNVVRAERFEGVCP